MELWRQSAALLGEATAGADRSDSEDSEEEDDTAFAVLAAAGVAACSVAPNTQSVHAGEYEQHDWRDWDTSHFEAHFRFDRADVQRLVTALKLPAEIHTRERKKFTSHQAITALLLRFNNKSLHDIHRLTGLRPSASSTLLSWTYDFIYERWYIPLLASDLKRWSPDFPDWAAAVYEKTDDLGFDNTPAFIDGTLRGITRPAHSQDIYFNCHHWMHGVLWQALQAPNGLTIDLAGPMTGRRHDRQILKKSKLLSRWAAANLSAGWADDEFRIYGDAGYWISRYLQAAYHRVAGYLAADKQKLNGVMSKVRIAVEWGFGRVLSLWPFFNFTTGQQLGRQPVAKMYVTGVLLTNAFCCLYGNQTCEYFGVDPPSLEDYFGLAPPQPGGRAQAWDDNVSG
jgi:hypothetical protein